MKTEHVEKLIDSISDLMKENSRLNIDISLLEHEYADLNDKFLKLEHEYTCLSNFTASVDSTDNNMVSLTEAVDESDSSEPIPVDEMATTTPAIADKRNDQDGIFPSPASAVHSMVTGTTEQKCFPLTSVIKDLSKGPNVSRRVLREQGLFEYRKDEAGNNRFLPTSWFHEYSVSHGILAEFTGHTRVRGKDITFSWFKVTPHGVKIIQDTAEGRLVWKKFNGPNEYIPVKVD